MNMKTVTRRGAAALSLALSAAFPIALGAVPATAQEAPVRTIQGTRLEVFASGDVTRRPDTILIDAGVSATAQTAAEATRLLGERADALRAALRRAGLADGDIQTERVSLNASYSALPDRETRFDGYVAVHRLSVRFRDDRFAGRILDTLASAGAMEIQGPTFEISDPEAAADEARLAALATARARAERYAAAAGMRVKRIATMREAADPEMTIRRRRSRAAQNSQYNISIPDERVSVGLIVVFELE